MLCIINNGNDEARHTGTVDTNESTVFNLYKSSLVYHAKEKHICVSRLLKNNSDAVSAFAHNLLLLP